MKRFALLATLFLGVWLAVVAVVRRARAAERAAANRYLHDTVLQTLEAFALATPSDASHAPAKLAELRSAARAQAAVVRRNLDRPTGSGRLCQDLDAVVTELSRDGLRASLVAADVSDELPPARRLALRDATREALRNTLKHAGTSQVVVRVEERAGGVAVLVRDHGVGFDVDSQRGFGISESIVARLAAAGGTASIESRPGWGTRVALWVPR